MPRTPPGGRQPGILPYPLDGRPNRRFAGISVRHRTHSGVRRKKYIKVLTSYIGPSPRPSFALICVHLRLNTESCNLSGSVLIYVRTPEPYMRLILFLLTALTLHA